MSLSGSLLLEKYGKHLIINLKECIDFSSVTEVCILPSDEIDIN